MATTYLAPGVYVEEVPSAQQPIAGVGTNTVGFIGIVPDDIYYPEPNPDYDPVLAQVALRLRTLSAQTGQATDADRARLEEIRQRDLRSVESSIASKNTEIQRDEANI